MLDDHGHVVNTDKEIWRQEPDNYYSPSIHVTADGLIGMDVGGFVVVMPVKKWHDLGKLTELMLRWAYVMHVEHSDSITGLHVDDNYRDWIEDLRRQAMEWHKASIRKSIRGE